MILLMTTVITVNSWTFGIAAQCSVARRSTTYHWYVL